MTCTCSEIARDMAEHPNRINPIELSVSCQYFCLPPGSVRRFRKHLFLCTRNLAGFNLRQLRALPSIVIRNLEGMTM